MAELSGLGAIVRTALSSLTGAARLAHTAINGLGTAAIANVGAAEGNVPALGEGGKLDPGVLPDDLGTGTGDVTGPASPVANGAAVVWDGITGRALRSAGGPPLLQSALTTALAAVEPRATLIDRLDYRVPGTRPDGRSGSHPGHACDTGPDDRGGR